MLLCRQWNIGIRPSVCCNCIQTKKISFSYFMFLMPRPFRIQIIKGLHRSFFLFIYELSCVTGEENKAVFPQFWNQSNFSDTQSKIALWFCYLNHSWRMIHVFLGRMLAWRHKAELTGIWIHMTDCVFRAESHYPIRTYHIRHYEIAAILIKMQ